MLPWLANHHRRCQVHCCRHRKGKRKYPTCQRDFKRVSQFWFWLLVPGYRGIARRHCRYIDIAGSREREKRRNPTCQGGYRFAQFSPNCFGKVSLYRNPRISVWLALCGFDWPPLTSWIAPCVMVASFIQFAFGDLASEKWSNLRIFISHQSINDTFI